MSKKHEMTEQGWEAYRKAHPYDDLLEAEQSKIAREKACYGRRQSRAEARANQRLRDLVANIVQHLEDDLDDGDDPFVAERARRNVRTRKRRLQSLARREDDGGGASAEHPDGLLAGNE